MNLEKKQWATYSKEWLDERCEEWKSNIEPKLEFIAANFEDFDKKEIARYKKYFERGELDRNNDEYSLIILLLLHVSTSKAELVEFALDFLSGCSKNKIHLQYEFSKDILLQGTFTDCFRDEYKLGVLEEKTLLIWSIYYENLNNFPIDKYSKLQGARGIVKSRLESTIWISDRLKEEFIENSSLLPLYDYSFGKWAHNINNGDIWKNDIYSLRSLMYRVYCLTCDLDYPIGRFFQLDRRVIYKEDVTGIQKNVVEFESSEREIELLVSFAKRVETLFDNLGKNTEINKLWEKSKREVKDILEKPFEHIKEKYSALIKEGIKSGRLPQLEPESEFTIEDLAEKWSNVAHLLVDEGVVDKSTKYSGDIKSVDSLYSLFEQLVSRHMVYLGDFSDIDGDYVEDRKQMINKLLTSIYSKSDFEVEFEDRSFSERDGLLVLEFESDEQQVRWSFSEDSMIEFFDCLIPWIQSLELPELFWAKESDRVSLVFLSESIVNKLKSLGYEGQIEY